MTENQHTFCMHKGAYPVSLEELAQAPLPEATATHHPVHHYDFLMAVIDAAQRFDFEITGQQHAMWGEHGERYFGLLTLKNDYADDWAPAIGLRNSNDKAFSLRASAGNKVFICDNLSLTGEIDERRKHTKQINDELGYMMWMIMKRLQGMLLNQKDRINWYKETCVSQNDADHIIMDAMRGGVIPCQYIGHVDRVYRSDEQMDNFGYGTFWALQNAFTEVMKGRVIGDPRGTIGLTKILDHQSGYKQEAEDAIH